MAIFSEDSEKPRKRSAFCELLSKLLKRINGRCCSFEKYLLCWSIGESMSSDKRFVGRLGGSICINKSSRSQGRSIGESMSSEIRVPDPKGFFGRSRS